MKYFVIDGMNLAYRAHLSHIEAQTSDGRKSGMFYGYVAILLSLKKKYRQYKFVVAWDHKPLHKYELMPTYKTGRSTLPDSVFYQMPYIKDFLKSAGIDQYDKKDQEADDVIASFVESKGKEPDSSFVIYTNDKDMLQLVKDGKVTVYKPKVGIHLEKFYDEEAVKEKFGVLPKDLALFRCFDGDISDAIKGIERVPRKIISSIIEEHNTIDDFFKAVEVKKLTTLQKETILEFKATAERNYKLVKLDKNLSDLNIVQGCIDVGVVESLFKEFEIKSIKAATLVDLFSSSLNIRYSDPHPPVELESYSLF